MLDGIRGRDEMLTGPLRDAADLVIDTSDLPLPDCAGWIERRFGVGASETRAGAPDRSPSSRLRFPPVCPARRTWCSTRDSCATRTMYPD